MKRPCFTVRLGRLRFWQFVCAAISCCLVAGYVCAAQGSESDTILKLIRTYATAVDGADARLAESIWSNAPEVTFIHPLGEERGRAQIEENVYRRLMGDTFSERKLVPKDISVHVYGDTAWSEFNWDFYAKLRKDHSDFHSRGRETQIYHRQNGKWQIVHVHYSGVPVEDTR